MGSRTLVVIGPDVEEQLGRFRWFPETGWVDHHVVSVDVLKSSREKWEHRWAETMAWYVRDPSGRLRDKWEKSPTGQSLFVHSEPSGVSPLSDLDRMVFGEETVNVCGEEWRCMLKLPPGHEAVQAKYKDFVSFAQWLQTFQGLHRLEEGGAPELEGTHKFGWMRLDSSGQVIEAIERTIPGGFWFPSWCVVADAWKLKPDAVGEPAPHLCFEAPPGHAGSARKGAIDFDAMQGARWDEIHGTPEALATMTATDHGNIIGLLPRDEYVRRLRHGTLSKYDLIVNGKLICETPPEYRPPANDPLAAALPWCAYIEQLVDPLPEDTVLTLVCCRC